MPGRRTNRVSSSIVVPLFALTGLFFLLFAQQARAAGCDSGLDILVSAKFPPFSEQTVNGFQGIDIDIISGIMNARQLPLQIRGLSMETGPENAGCG